MALSPTHVLVVDDHELWRVFLTQFLRRETELQVVVQAADGVEAVHKAHNLQPEVVLLDIGLPGLNGIEAARQIRCASPKSKILFITENRSLEIVEEAMSTGAVGFLVKSDVAKDLRGAIRAILSGQRFLSSCLSDDRAEILAYGPPRTSPAM
jgi:DNA-binding NarL/FixJ family response regulator